MAISICYNSSFPFCREPTKPYEFQKDAERMRERDGNFPQRDVQL